MPFLGERARGLWVTRVMVLVGCAWVGVSLADPPRCGARSDTLVAPVEDEGRHTTTDELGAYLEQLERHLDWMHRRAVSRKDADTLAAVESIQKKLAVAKDRHRTLCRLCAKELSDTRMARECCQVIDDIMHEVIDDHLALMRRLRARHPAPTRIKRIQEDARPAPSLDRGL